jgi:hypothetical protein
MKRSFFIKNPSKPQVQLYEKVKLLYSSAVLNYPCLNYSIDIAIPELKVAQDKESDRKRQTKIEEGGWKFLRYGKIPEDGKLKKDLEIHGK